MKFAMVIDLDKCTGCRACVVACKIENNVPLSRPKDVEERRVIQWMEMIPVSHETPFKFMPRPCFMCDNPPCIKVCPVGATYKGEYGIIGQIYPRCIGCRYCMNNCPYNVKFFNWYAPKWEKEYRKSVNPDVSLRPKGVVEKCTFCHHRLQKAKEKARVKGRAIKEGDYIPACVEICPAKAIHFGDIDNPNSVVSELASSPRAMRLLEDMGTEPKVIYLSEEIVE